MIRALGEIRSWSFVVKYGKAPEEEEEGEEGGEGKIVDIAFEKEGLEIIVILRRKMRKMDDLNGW